MRCFSKQQPKKLDELFHDTLKDIYFAETTILSTLPRMAKAARSEKLKAWIRSDGAMWSGNSFANLRRIQPASIAGPGPLTGVDRASWRSSIRAYQGCAWARTCPDSAAPVLPSAKIRLPDFPAYRLAPKVGTRAFRFPFCWDRTLRFSGLVYVRTKGLRPVSAFEGVSSRHSLICILSSRHFCSNQMNIAE
jgi:hypothetical protein